MRNKCRRRKDAPARVAEGARFSTCRRICSRRTKSYWRTREEYRRTSRAKRLVESRGISSPGRRNSIAKGGKGLLASRHRSQAPMDFTRKPDRRGLPGGTYSYLTPSPGIYQFAFRCYSTLRLFKDRCFLCNSWTSITARHRCPLSFCLLSDHVVL